MFPNVFETITKIRDCSLVMFREVFFCEQSSQKTRELRREIMLCMISVHREACYWARSEQ